MYNFFNEDKKHILSAKEMMEEFCPDDSYKQAKQKIAKPAEKKKLSMREVYDNIIDVLIEEGKIKIPKDENEGECEEEGEDEKTPAKSTKCTI